MQFFWRCYANATDQMSPPRAAVPFPIALGVNGKNVGALKPVARQCGGSFEAGQHGASVVLAAGLGRPCVRHGQLVAQMGFL